MRLKERVKYLLAGDSLHPKSFLSQNFLIDHNLVTRVVEEFRPSLTDRVVEIGAGTGILTEALAHRTGQLWALEIDGDLCRILERQMQAFAGVKVIQSDALTFDFAAFCPREMCTKIIGNLPYHVALAIILRLAVQPWWHMMLFTVQREQAQRFIAEPGSKMRGANTVVLSYHARMERIIDLPPQAFYPMPRVSSSVVRFVPRQGPRAVNYRLFRRIVRAGFDMRRKTLVNSLSRGLALPRIRVQQVLASSGIEVRRRAEELDVLDFIRLTKALSDSSEVSGETALISPEIRPEGSNGKR